MDDSGKLANVRYISIAQTTQRRIGDFSLDPQILLPVELLPGKTEENTSNVSWEAIITGALTVLAYDHTNANAGYYRKFLLAVKPEIKEEFTHLGIMKARDGDHEIAIEVFRALEGLFPEDAPTHMNLALVYDERARGYEKSGKLDLAEELQGLAFEAYKRALADDPSEPTIHFNLAFFYLHHRSFEKAREHLEVFVKTASGGARVEEARRIIRDIDTQGLVDDLFQKAYDSIRLGREEEGIAAIRRFLQTHPKVPNAWFILGWGLRRLARYAEGREAFMKALEHGAPHADILNELAICLMELGDLKESEERLLHALRVEPENTKVISNLGIVAMKKGRIEEARGFFRTVLEIDPQDAIAARYLENLPNPG